MFRIADAEIAEALLWFLWRNYLPENRRLRLTDGRTVRIHTPGELNPDSGPDFIHAELSFGPGRRFSGDVEIHVRPSDWRKHGHHQDPRYNGVILHVVMWSEERNAPIVKQNGQHVPELILSEHLRESLERIQRRYERAAKSAAAPYPCQILIQESTPESVIALLMEVGRRRFISRAQNILERMRRVSPEQTLYERLMRTAGYARNTGPFSELARKLPFQTIREFTRNTPPTRIITAVQALLFGTAGLLPSQNTDLKAHPAVCDAYTLELEQWWEMGRERITDRPVASTRWQFFRLRPDNFPTARLAGMSYLIATGLPDGLDTLFSDALRMDRYEPRSWAGGIRTCLDFHLTHPGAEYWLTHSHFGIERRTRQRRLIGPDRQNDMLLNALLPFFMAQAQTLKDTALVNALLTACMNHPPLSSNRALETMTDLIFRNAPEKKPRIRRAALQQALLHIHEEVCRMKQCERCVFSASRPQYRDTPEPLSTPPGAPHPF